MPGNGNSKYEKPVQQPHGARICLKKNGAAVKVLCSYSSKEVTFVVTYKFKVRIKVSVRVRFSW